MRGHDKKASFLAFFILQKERSDLKGRNNDAFEICNFQLRALKYTRVSHLVLASFLPVQQTFSAF